MPSCRCSRARCRSRPRPRSRSGSCRIPRVRASTSRRSRRRSRRSSTRTGSPAPRSPWWTGTAPSGPAASARRTSPATVDATEDHLFRIGSISKSFTALAVLHAVEGGLLDLDAPVRELAPEVAFTNRLGEDASRHRGHGHGAHGGLRRHPFPRVREGRRSGHDPGRRSRLQPRLAGQPLAARHAHVLRQLRPGDCRLHRREAGREGLRGLRPRARVRPARHGDLYLPLPAGRGPAGEGLRGGRGKRGGLRPHHRPTVGRDEQLVAGDGPLSAHDDQPGHARRRPAARPGNHRPDGNADDVACRARRFHLRLRTRQLHLARERSPLPRPQRRHHGIRVDERVLLRSRRRLLRVDQQAERRDPGPRDAPGRAPDRRVREAAGRRRGTARRCAAGDDRLVSGRYAQTAARLRDQPLLRHPARHSRGGKALHRAARRREAGARSGHGDELPARASAGRYRVRGRRRRRQSDPPGSTGRQLRESQRRLADLPVRGRRDDPGAVALRPVLRAGVGTRQDPRRPADGPPPYAALPVSGRTSRSSSRSSCRSF